MTQAITVLQQLAAEAEAKLLVYDTKFVDAQNLDVGAADYLRSWMYTPTMAVDPSVQKVRIVVPISAAELRELKGRRIFQKNTTAFVDLTKKPFQYGESEDYKVIAALDWMGFGTAPERLSFLTKIWASQNGAELLNTGENVSGWNGTFLSATVRENRYRKSSVPRTFRTFWPNTPLTHANVEAIIADMVARRGFSNENLGIRPDTLFTSPELYPTALSIAKNDRLASGETNPILKWGIEVKPLQHLAAKRWGIADEKAIKDRFPVFGVIEGEEEFNTWGRDSALFEQALEMGYDIVRDLGIALLRNEAIAVAVAP